MKNGAPLLFYGDSYRFPDVYHTIRFLAPDPQIVLDDGSEIVMLTNSLEQGRRRRHEAAARDRHRHRAVPFVARAEGGRRPAVVPARPRRRTAREGPHPHRRGGPRAASP